MGLQGDKEVSTTKHDVFAVRKEIIIISSLIYMFVYIHIYIHSYTLISMKHIILCHTIRYY